MNERDKAVVQQALEFLEMISPQFPPLVYTETDRKRDEASTALRQLLEQQEPVAWHDKIMGMEVSMDVSTGDDDIDHRVYGTVYEVIFQDDGGTPDVILAIETERNFTTPPAQSAREPVAWRSRDANGKWMYGDAPAPELPGDQPEFLGVIATPAAQPADHADELTIAYLDGVHTGKKIAKPDYAWPTVQDYEREVGYEVNDTFKGAWAMARTTKDMLEQMSGGKP
jgi:hypothetical protein